MGKKMQHGLEFTIEDMNDVLAFTSIEETMACSLHLRTKTQIHPFTYYNDIFWLLETDRRPDMMFNKKKSTGHTENKTWRNNQPVVP